MRNEQPIGPTKSILKRMRLIEIDRGDVDTSGAMRALRGVGWIFLDMSKLPLYLGTISPTYMERSFHEVK